MRATPFGARARGKVGGHQFRLLCHCSFAADSLARTAVRGSLFLLCPPLSFPVLPRRSGGAFLLAPFPWRGASFCEGIPTTPRAHCQTLPPRPCPYVSVSQPSGLEGRGIRSFGLGCFVAASLCSAGDGAVEGESGAVVVETTTPTTPAPPHPQHQSPLRGYDLASPFIGYTAPSCLPHCAGLGLSILTYRRTKHQGTNPRACLVRWTACASWFLPVRSIDSDNCALSNLPLRTSRSTCPARGWRSLQSTTDRSRTVTSSCRYDGGALEYLYPHHSPMLIPRASTITADHGTNSADHTANSSDNGRDSNTRGKDSSTHTLRTTKTAQPTHIPRLSSAWRQLN